MQKPFFSIIVVSLNPGQRLEKTLESILNQTYENYEVILKDGGSTDGSTEKVQKLGKGKNKIKIIQNKDFGIYDGMNQAISYVNGRYVQFLNCGDYFYSDKTLEEVAGFIMADQKKSKEVYGNRQENSEGKEMVKEENEFAITAIEKPKMIYYGNQYNQLQGTIIYSAPEINDFTCYRNVPCHQVCFYDYRLFERRAYELKYKVRADYEHFLYSVYEEQAQGVSMPIVVASYEGGGFSETKENRKKSSMEHKEITVKYLGKGKVWKYRMIMWMTLAPVRTMIAENPALSGIYNGVKNSIYKLIRK